MPSKRGSALAAVVNDKIYVVASYHHSRNEGNGCISTHPHISWERSRSTIPPQHLARAKCDADSPQPCAIGVVAGKIYVIGGRVGAAFIGLASDISVVEEYDPVTISERAPGACRLRAAQSGAVYRGRIYVPVANIRILI